MKIQNLFQTLYMDVVCLAFSKYPALVCTLSNEFENAKEI